MSLIDIESIGRRAYALFVKSGVAFQFILLLFFRLNWGWQFFINGKGKLIGHHDVAEFFASLNLPLPDMTAWLIGGIECFGGVLLLVGLATRPVGLLLALTMLGAYLSVTDDKLTILNFVKDQDPFFKADPFFFMLAGLLAFGFGGGPISVDNLLKKYLNKNDEKRVLEAEKGAEGVNAVSIH